MMAGAMLLATSCEKGLDEVATVNETATVSIQVKTPEIATRAYSDGTTATQLQYAVYAEEDDVTTYLEDLTVTDAEMENLGASVKLDLVTGNTYTVVFWAAAENAPYTFIPADHKIVVNYNGVSNDEARDAFYAHHTFTVNGAQNEVVELKRPFAQINVGTSDYTKAEKAGLEVKESKFVANNVYSTLDLKSDAVSNPVNATFNWAEIAKTEVFPYDSETYKYMAMNYVLVSADQELVDVEFSYRKEDGAKEYTRTVGSVPVQRNFRTNIFGKLITSQVDINITINPAYDEPAKEPSALYHAAAFGGEYTLTEDVVLPSTLNVQANMSINLNGKTMTGAINLAEGVSLSVENGAIVNTDNTINGITSNGNLTLNNVEVTSARHAVRIESGKVVINGGIYKVDPVSKSTLYALNIGDANTVADVTINGGEFIGPKGTMADSGSAVAVKAGSTLVINGGKYSGGKSKTVTNKGDLTINGGSFDQAPAAEWLVEGTDTVLKDGFYVVVPQIVADLFDVTEATTITMTEDLNVAAGTTIQTYGATAPITIEGDGKSIVSVAESANDFQWSGTIPAMSTVFSSEDGSLVTVNNLTFEGTMSALMLGHYVDSNSNWYNTELNNVNVINTEVVSFSENIAPAVCVYGKATLNNCNVYGTTLSELDTDPMWPVYDVAVVNEAVLTLKESNIGSIIAWAKSKIVVEEGSVVESIKPIYTSMNTNAKYGVVIKAGATVNVLDLSNISLPAKKINITVEEGATVGKVIDANGFEYASLDAYKGSKLVSSQDDLNAAIASGSQAITVTEGTYTFPAGSIAAGQTINCAEGVVFTGKSSLNIKGATVVGATFKNEGDQAVSGTINGTFKNCTFEGSETLRWCYTNAGETAVFENCEILTTKRGIHFDVMNGDVIFRGCKINGFNAYSGAGTMTFENCTFGNDASNYNGLNIYTNTIIKDCKFNYISGKTNFIDMEGTGKTLTIENCTATLDGAAANVADFIGGSQLANNTVVIK